MSVDNNCADKYVDKKCLISFFLIFFLSALRESSSLTRNKIDFYYYANDRSRIYFNFRRVQKKKNLIDNNFFLFVIIKVNNGYWAYNIIL